MSRKKKWISYISFGITAFLFFVYFLFPFDLIVEQGLVEARKAFPGFDIRVKKMRQGLAFNAKLDGVEVVKLTGEATPVALLAFKRISIDPSFFSLIRGQIAVEVEVEGSDGTLSFAINEEGGATAISAVFDGIDLTIFPYLKESLHLGLSGALYGNLDVVWDAAVMNRTDGTVNLEFREFTLQPSKIKAMEGLEVNLPKTRLSGKGNSYLKADIEKGRIQIKSWDLVGEDIVASLSGRVPLNKKFSSSRLYLKGNIQISDEYEKTYFTSGGQGVDPALVLLWSTVAKQKNPDGILPLSVTGTFEKPQMRINKLSLPF